MEYATKVEKREGTLLSKLDLTRFLDSERPKSNVDYSRNYSKAVLSEDYRRALIEGREPVAIESD